MAKRDMKAALKGSLLMEEQSINERFQKADALFSETSQRSADEKEKKINVREVKKQKEKPVKVIRDSFTMPQTDYELIIGLKKRSLRSGVEITKSEILRAGLLALNQMNESDFLNELSKVEKIKTGRPKQNS